MESPGQRSIINQTFQSSIQALTYDDPPALLSLGGEEGSNDRPGHLVLSLQLHLDVDGLPAGQVVLIQHLVGQLYVGVPGQDSFNQNTGE